MSARLPRRLAHVIVALAAIALCPASLLAHAVVYPKSAERGAYERYLLRVPNEKAVATTRVELRFQAGLRVTAFSDVPGWQLEVRRDSAQRIVGAVWTGTLPPERFVELPFIAVNPKDAPTITWVVAQTYADGQRVDWSGPAGSKSPASVTTIGDAAATSSPRTGWVSWAALALSLVALGIALRPAGKQSAVGADRRPPTS